MMHHEREYKQTGKFKSLGEFAVAVRKQIDGHMMDGRLDEWYGFCRKTATESSDSGGGFLVPQRWANEIYNAALEDAIVRSRAIVHKMTTDTENIPILVDSDRSSNIFGGIAFTWTEEAADKGGLAADPKLGNLKLTAHKGVAVTFVSNELEDDADNFEGFIKTAFGKAIRFYEDDYYIHGNGVGQPLGIMTSGYTIAATRTTTNKIDIADFGNMAARFLPGSFASGIWLINSEVLPQLVELQATAANSASVLNLGDMQCLGMPIVVTEKCAALGTTGDIILADFKNGYVIGDRSLEIAGSRHVDYSSGTQGFLRDTTCWRIVLRVDGQTILSSPITPRRGGSTLSSFVVLSTSS